LQKLFILYFVIICDFYLFVRFFVQFPGKIDFRFLLKSSLQKTKNIFFEQIAEFERFS